MIFGNSLLAVKLMDSYFVQRTFYTFFFVVPSLPQKKNTHTHTVIVFKKGSAERRREGKGPFDLPQLGECRRNEQ